MAIQAGGLLQGNLDTSRVISGGESEQGSPQREDPTHRCISARRPYRKIVFFPYPYLIFVHQINFQVLLSWTIMSSLVWFFDRIEEALSIFGETLFAITGGCTF